MKNHTKLLYGLVFLAGIFTFTTLSLFGQTVTTFTSNNTWVVPLGVTSVKIEAWGGGGGGAIGNVLSGTGNGGGGGAFATQTFSVNAGETYFITVGAGGSGNALDLLNPTNKDGKASSFTGPYGTLTASGGLGGTATSGGGNGGTGNYNGGKGGSTGSGYSGAGGGSAGNAGSGVNGGTTAAGAGGTGDPNVAPYKGGAGGVGRNTTGVGNVGNIPGGGGGGGKGATAATYAGGTGARGQVVITFSYDQCYDGTLTLKQGTGAVNQTVEQYYPISDIAFDLGGNATGVNVTGLPVGVTGSLNLGVYTISGTPLESGTFDYTITTTGTPSPCQEDEINGTLTVNPEPYNPMAGRVVFNESGTWQVPLNVSTITISAWGGGGGGGAASNGAGGGGGGGAYVTSTIPVTSGDVYAFTIGGGGSGGVYTIGSPGAANGAAGNPSIVQNPGNATILTATGGSGGGGGLGTLSGLEIIQNNGNGGAGGTGDFNGGTGGTGNNTSGSGGGGAGSAGNGGNGSTTGPGTGGQGSPNIAPFIGGNGGSQRSNNGNGNAGGLPGAGGSGARAWNYGPGYSGGGGAHGQVIITFVYDGCNDATITLTSPVGTDNQSVCYNIPIETIKYTIGGFATGAEADGLPTGLTTGFNAGVFTISGTPTESGTFNFSVTTTGVPDPCVNATAYGTIVVGEVPGSNGEVMVEFNASDTWEVPAGVTSITVEAWGGGGAGGGVEISIFGIGGGGGGGAYALKTDMSVTPLEILNIVVSEEIAGTPEGDGTNGGFSTIEGFENEIYAEGGKGGKKSASVFSSGSAAGGEGGKAINSKGDCTVSGITGTNGYRFELLVQPATDAGAGGHGATVNGGSGGAPVGDFIGDGKPGDAPGGGGSGSRSGLTTSFNTKGGSGAAGRVIIYFTCPEFDLDLTSAAGTDDQNACINENITDIVYEIVGGATGAEVTGLPDGISGAVDNDTFTISGASTEAGTFGYTITTTGHVSPCTPATISGTITIEDVATAGELVRNPDVDFICQGSNVSAKLTAGSGGNGVDELQYRTKTGSSWSGWLPYTSESNISTTGKTGVEIQTRRTASYCANSSYNTVSWNIDLTPPVVVAKSGASVTLEPTGNYTLQASDVLSSWTDAGVGIQSVTLVPATLNCTHVGLTTITVTVKDYCGNETVVTPQITVLEGSDFPPDWFKADTYLTAYGSSSYSLCTNNGTFYLTSKGLSTTTNDVMHFVYKQIGTTATIIARIANVKNDGWAGVMMRESNAPNAKTILFKTRLYNPTVIIGTRSNTGSSITNTSQSQPNLRWMKIQRNGNTFQVFVSANGTSWTRAYTANIAMNNTIYAGIFTDNYTSSKTTQAWFDNVELSNTLKSGDDIAEADIINLESEDSEVQIYPNPAKDVVNITMKGFRTLEGFGTLVTTDGKTVKTFTITGNQTQLNVQDLQPGVYILRIESTENVVVKRLVIQ